MKHAVINNNIVENIIEYDGTSPYDPGEGRSIEQVNDWIDIGMDKNTPQPTPSAPTETQLKAYLANYRYQKEVGGVVIGQDTIQTDRETRGSLIGARIKAVEDSGYSLTWKAANGFVELNAAQIIYIADAVAEYVRRCYVAEKEVYEIINTYTSFSEIETAFDISFSNSLV